MKNKLYTWLLGAAGTMIRRVAIALVGWLAGQNMIGEDAVEPGVTFVAALLTGLMELGLYLWRTKNGKAVQKAVGVKQDGVIGAITVAAAQHETAPKPYRGLHGGRPGY